MVDSLGLRVKGLEYRVYALRHRVLELMYRVKGLGLVVTVMRYALRD
jgi:hypothetical protein